MIEITWRFDPRKPVDERVPTTPDEAADRLRAGNRAFAGLTSSIEGDSLHVLPVSADDLGLGAVPGMPPTQAPFAAILGCADSRVPLELVFLQSANSIFAVRVAGNVLGAECVGSLDYAVSHLPSLRLLAVVGHTGCGAVGAAVDAYLDPTTYLALSANLPLRAIVDAIMPAVRGAARALRLEHTTDVVHRAGYRAALVDTCVVINSAVAADAIHRMFQDSLGGSLAVALGVYDLASRRVGLPAPAGGADPWQPGLVPAPLEAAFRDFVSDLVRSPYVLALLDMERSTH